MSSEIHEPSVSISIVIPAYRGRVTIADTILSVLACCQGFLCEIIVVESSNDGTVKFIHDEFPEVRTFQIDTQISAGQARNLGAREAQGRYLFFVDQDCVVPKNWITEFVEELERKDVGAVGGSIGFRNWSNWSGSAVYFLEFLYHFPSRRAPTVNSNSLIGCNLACHKRVFDQVSFPELTLTEDFLFCLALRQAGWSIVYKPTVTVMHWNREGWGEFFRYNCKMGHAAEAYQHAYGRRLYSWTARFPWLIFLTPVAILPRIAIGLVGNWRYFRRFILLLPICFLGNVAWCWTFYQRLIARNK